MAKPTPSPEANPAPAPNRDSAMQSLSSYRRALHVLIAAFGGVVQCLAFAGFAYWPLIFVCFLPMMWLREQEPQASTRRVLFLGWVHGTVGYTGGYYWLVDMLENFSGFGFVANWGIAFIFFAFHGTQQMLIYWLYWRARDEKRGAPISATLALVPALVTMEHIFPFLFPSFLATGFHEVPVFLQVVDLGGPILLSAVGIAINGALFDAYLFLNARRSGKSAPFPKLAVGIPLAALLFTLGYGAYRISEVDGRGAASPRVKVAMVQVDMGIFEKRDDPAEGHRRHLQQSVEVLSRHPDLDLLVWPESAYTSVVRPEIPGFVRNRVLGPVSEYEVPVLFGGLAIRAEDGGRNLYNTAFLTDAQGDVVGTYDKTFLLAFGEYLPFGDEFPVLYEWSPNTSHFTHGSSLEPMLVDNMRITTLICYEDVLPGFTRDAVAVGDPNLLVNVTNDAWFGDTQEPQIHLALAKFRAVEHHRALVRSTNSGITAFIDPVGRELGRIEVGEAEEIVATLPLLEDNTIYAALGNWPGWLGFITCLYLSFFRGRRRKKDGSASPKAPKAAPVTT